LEIDRQTILEELDIFNINKNKNIRKRKLKRKFNYDDIDDDIDNNNNNNNSDNDNNNNNNINQRKQTVIKNPQMHETLNVDPLKINNSDYTNDWIKQHLFKYYNRLDNTEGKKEIIIDIKNFIIKNEKWKNRTLIKKNYGK
jgi:hypothetical protein